jgi:predicted enzyme related to lactoylglutathione lyase
MNAKNKPAVGSITWRDLTVEDAAEVRSFYGEVVGWESQAHPMGEYDDYEMTLPGGGPTVAGICHARGTNAKIPPQWLIYITVADVAESAKKCVLLGGEILDGPRPMGRSPFCVIRDPAGAVAALIEA